MPKITPRKLGKLSLAVLENFVKSKLGEDFIEELRGDYYRAGAIVQALEATEARFISDFKDKDLSKALFVDLKQKDRPILKDAVGKFYDHPTDPDFPDAIQKILLAEFKKLSGDRVSSAVDFYIELLTEELALVDETFRENVRALADLRGSKSEQEMVEILRRIEARLGAPSITAEEVVPRALHQLPPAPVEFFGREAELNELLLQLTDQEHPAIAGITGMGGIGKTALALVAASRLTSEYPDAQIYLDLQGLSDPLTPAAVMQHVVLAFHPLLDLSRHSEDALRGLYMSTLSSKKAFLLFDNASDAAQVRRLIPPDSCAVIVTSRQVFTLPGLKNLIRLGRLAADDAVLLLRRLCSRLSQAQAHRVSELCGYLPLALQIAGASLAVNLNWSPEDYVRRLAEHRLLTLKGEEADPEADLEAAIDFSYQQLDDEEQLLWRKISLLPDLFPREAAAAVWKTSSEGAEAQLSPYTRRSLLEYDNAQHRYRMHDLLREFAAWRISAQEYLEAATALSKFYLDVLTEANELLLHGGEGTLVGLNLFDSESINIMVGQGWSVLHAKDSRQMAELCSDYPTRMSILALRLHPRLLLEWLDQAIAASRALGDKGRELTNLSNLAGVYNMLGDPDKTIEYANKAIVLAQKIGNLQVKGVCLGNLGSAYHRIGESDKSVSAYERALEIAREVGDPLNEAVWLGNLGGIFIELNQLEMALGHFEGALKIARKSGNRRGESQALKDLAIVYSRQGKSAETRRSFEESLAIAREIGDFESEADVLANVGAIFYEQGDTSQGIQLVQEALAIYDRIGSPSRYDLEEWLKKWGASE